MPARRVAVIVGSLRKESFSRRVANALRAMQPPTLNLEIVEIRDLPLYNQDLETETPPLAWSAFRDAVRAHDAVLFVSPEYNRSIPAPLKNAIDVGSRPYGKSCIAGKPCAIVTTSPGAYGGFGANHQIRQAVVFLDMPTMQMPELYINAVDKVVDASGTVQSDKREMFDAFLKKFATWIERNIAKA